MPVDSARLLFHSVFVQRFGKWQADRVNGDTDSQPSNQPVRRDMSFRRAFAAPAFNFNAETSYVGTLPCAGQIPRRLSANELQLLTSMADQIGVAVENARLFAGMSDKSIALEKANFELHEASRIKSEFMAAMSHELRTKLGSFMTPSHITFFVLRIS